MDEERYEEIAQDADEQISKIAGKDRAGYIQGLEIVTGHLEICLVAAKSEQEAEDDGN